MESFRPRRYNRIQTVDGRRSEIRNSRPHELGEDGIEHLAEIIPEEGGLEKIDDIPTFDVLEIHEKDEETGSYLASVNLTHSIPMMMLDLEKIHLHPYGLDMDGLELNFTGRSDSMKRLIELFKITMPWDSISIQSVKSNEGDVWRDILTERQIEVCGRQSSWVITLRKGASRSKIWRKAWAWPDLQWEASQTHRAISDV